MFWFFSNKGMIEDHTTQFAEQEYTQGTVHLSVYKKA
jgi:hypothetical protein